MNAVALKIHPFLLSSLPAKREALLMAQAEAALRFELEDERIEEREYDEQARLRRERVTSRKVFRGEAHERYALLVAGLRREGAEAPAMKLRLHRQLDEDLRATASQATVRSDLSGALRRYGDLLPAERWPIIFYMADAPARTGALKRDLAALGLAAADAGLLERFGIVKAACPPELTFLNEIAGLPVVHAVADPATPVRTPEPMAIVTHVAEARALLGVTGEMQELGADVTLAVLDTGLDRAHPAFARLLGSDYRNFTNFEDDDVEGHGTHVAGIAAADDPAEGGRFAGVAPRCRLVAGKVLSDRSVGDLEHVLNGMAWAVFEEHADVLSLSLGDDRTPANGRSIWTRACDEAFRQGTVVCVAAGNLDPAYPETIMVPGDAATAITVGAIDKAGFLARFSAQGSESPDSPLYGKPDCVAPGVRVASARSAACAYPPLGGDARHAELSGTSMAAPAVAGCLTIIKSKARSLGWEMTAEELRATLLDACRPLADPSGESYRQDFEIGHGLPDMGIALRLVEERATARPAVSATAPTGSVSRPSPRPAPVEPPRANLPAGTVPAAPATFEPNTCYYCGRRYLTQVGTFSPVWVCRECGAPICAVCWQIGRRSCERHASAPQPPPAPIAPPAPPAPLREPVHARGERVVMEPAPPSPNPPDRPDRRDADIFFTRFDLNVRATAEIKQPLSDGVFLVDPDVKAQAPKRKFGEVLQFTFSSGVFKRRRLVVAAVALDRAGLDSGGQPAIDVLKQISGPDGLDFADGTFYAVGVYSPTGWTDDWKQHAAIGGNAGFYLVERIGGTAWRVFGADTPLRDLFDPELPDEKRVRVEKLLTERLVVPGDQIDQRELQAAGLSPRIVDEVLAASRGRWQKIEHKGRVVIQRPVG